VPNTREIVIGEARRPMLAVVGGAFAHASLPTFEALLEAARPLLERAGAAVGRLEYGVERRVAGTGWLVQLPGESGIVVTNRHVAMRFAKPTDGGPEFRHDLDNRPIPVALELKAEGNRVESWRVPVAQVLHIERDGGLDLALLRLAAGTATPLPIQLGDAVEVGSNIAVIGFSTDNPGDTVDNILLSGRFGFKTLSPGTVTLVEATRIAHDASTTPGFSGAPVLDFQGRAVGVHFAGEKRVANFAVTVENLRRCLAVGIPV